MSKNIAQEALIDVTFSDFTKPNIHRFIKGFNLLINSFDANEDNLELMRINYLSMKQKYFNQIISNQFSFEELEKVKGRIIQELSYLEEILKEPFKISDNSNFNAAIGTNNKFAFHLSLLIREVYFFQELFVKLDDEKEVNSLKIFQITSK
jgi:hypothetical protein